MTNVELVAAFGSYLAPERATDWERAKAAMHAGASISGEVDARYIFGVFVDIGVGFPALLPITRFNLPPKRRPVVIEDDPPVGSTLRGRVAGFNEQNRQIGLTQLDPHPHLDRNTSGSDGGGLQ